MRERLRVGALQYFIRPVESFNQFADQTASLVATAKDYGVQLLVFPEYFTVQLLTLGDLRRGIEEQARDLVLQVPRHYGEQRGTFALRSPVRPNPIAASVVKLVAIEGARLSVIGLDCLDGTPLLDIKPYFASTDAVADAVVGWHVAQKS